MNEIDEIESKLNKYDLNSNKSSVKFQVTLLLSRGSDFKLYK